MAIRKNQRYEDLLATVMLGDQYAKDQTRENFEYNQALLDEEFEQMGNIYDIDEEVVRGSNLYTEIRASVGLVKNINSITSSADDFRTLLFRDAKHDVFIGKRYRFEKNYWLTTSTSKIDTLMSNSLVQRCKNTLKWYDYDTGKTYEEPCVVGDKITSTTTDQQTHIQIIEGQLSVTLQYNEISNLIKVNQRFILNGSAYTVRMLNKTQRQSTLDKDSIGTIYLELDVAEINPDTDDLDNNIAYIDNEVPTEEEILNGDMVTPNINELFIFSPYNIQEYQVYNYVDNIPQPDIFEFQFYDALINKYEVSNITGNGFTIKCLDFSPIPLTVECKNLVSGSVTEFVIKLSGVQ